MRLQACTTFSWVDCELWRKWAGTDVMIRASSGCAVNMMVINGVWTGMALGNALSTAAK